MQTIADQVMLGYAVLSILASGVILFYIMRGHSAAMLWSALLSLPFAGAIIALTVMGHVEYARLFLYALLAKDLTMIGRTVWNQKKQ